MSADDALQAIEPLETVVRVVGREIKVTPLRVRHLPGFGRAIEPIAGDLRGLFSEGAIKVEDLAGLLARSESLIDAVAIGAQVDRDWLIDQQLDVLLRLAVAVLNVNAAYFARSLAPVAVEALTKVATAARSADGTASLPDSSQPDSPAAISST